MNKFNEECYVDWALEKMARESKTFEEIWNDGGKEAHEEILDIAMKEMEKRNVEPNV